MKTRIKMAGLVLGLLWGAPGMAGPTRNIQTAVAKGKTETLVKGLAHKSSHVRELSALALARFSPSPEATTALRACVESVSERGYVRAACGRTLGAWKVRDADSILIGAMGQVDGESRYWLAAALAQLNTADGRAFIAGLTSDADLFLAASAREWSR